MHAASLQELQGAGPVPEADDQADQQRVGRERVQVGQLHGRSTRTMAVDLHHGMLDTAGRGCRVALPGLSSPLIIYILATAPIVVSYSLIE